MGNKFLRIFYPVAGFAVILLAWHYYIVLFKVPPVVLPGPLEVGAALVSSWRILLSESGITLLECISGFALAMVIGVPIAVIMTYSSVLNAMFYPLLVASQSIPKVALAPILLVWFGTGLESKLAMVFVIAFFPVVVDTATGLRTTSPELLELARSLQSSRLQTFFKIQLPSALPFIFSGAKIAVTLAVIGAVIGEFIGANAGLGNLLLVANSQMNTSLAWAALVVLSLLGMLLYAAVVLAERIFTPWGHGSEGRH
jgi:NitT/TauT family transport system permease protein